MHTKTQTIIAENKKIAEFSKNQPQKKTQNGLDINMIQTDIVYGCTYHTVDNQKVNDVEAGFYERLYIQDGMLRNLDIPYPNNGRDCPECNSEWLHNHGL